MTETRHRNVSWRIYADGARQLSWEQAQLAVLMDIRDELQTLNGRLGCSDFIMIPATLRAIRRNTAKPRKKKEARRG